MKYLLEKVSTKKTLLIKARDKEILSLLEKTGIKMDYYWKYSTKESWGMMAGIPGKPQMFLSTYALENFDKDELEWLVLHEVGHYVLNHSIKEAVYQILLLVVGIYIISLLNIQLYLSLLIAIPLAMLSVQIAKYHEYQAENFALIRMSNPQGMVRSGKRSFEHNVWGKKLNNVEYVFKKLFNRWDVSMYHQRIKMANNKLSKKY